MFFYQLLDPTVQFTYFGPDSSTGKCNTMGYWNTYNTKQVLNNQIVNSPASFTNAAANPYGPGPLTFLNVEANLCSDTCTKSSMPQCPYDSSTNPRADAGSRKPLTDISSTNSLPNLYQSQAPAGSYPDYKFFPDLQLFPATAGAVVPIFNIPELNATVLASASLILGRVTLKKIFNGEILTWNDPLILADNNPASYPGYASPQIFGILSKLNKPIVRVIRADSAGVSEILTNALALIDPPCASLGSSGATGLTVPTCQNWQDNSFGYQKVNPAVAAQSGNQWCVRGVVVVVDAHRIVPCQVTADRFDIRTHTIRPSGTKK